MTAEQQSEVNEIVKTQVANALADGLKLPFVVCMVNREGAVWAMRVHQDREAELLVSHDVGHGSGITTHGILLDQSGQRRISDALMGTFVAGCRQEPPIAG